MRGQQVQDHSMHAIGRDLPISPQKGRLVARLIQGLAVGEAQIRLRFMPQKAAKILMKLLNSAMSNAEHNAGKDVDLLYVQSVLVDGAKTLKRSMPRAKGRSNQILKRRSHILIHLDQIAGRTH